LNNLVNNSEYEDLRTQLGLSLQRELEKVGDKFMPRQYYIDKWNYKLNESGHIPYGSMKERYFSHLTDDAVYLGTDEWERWPKHPDFDDYVDGRFKDGSGWIYKSVDRTIRFNDRSDVAWFDDVLYSETNGRIRGTGVLTRQSGQWKLEHYAMSQEHLQIPCQSL